MTAVIIILGIALAVSLAYNLGLIGGAKALSHSHHHASSTSSANNSTQVGARSDEDRTRRLETELEKRKKELEEAKRAQSELKDELKSAKKKLFDLKETDKVGDDLARARHEVERQASIQLENTRSELSAALMEIQRLKAEGESRNRKAPSPQIDVAEKPAPKEKVPEVVQRIIRELSDVEKERIARLEQQASNDRKKANELERELRAAKGKLDRQQREAKTVYQDANLARDKFRAVEIRLNRTLLESDLLKRAIAALEKKTGQSAERVTLTNDEIADSDRRIHEKHVAEDKANAEAKAQLEAAQTAQVSEPEAAPEIPPSPRPSASA